MQQRKIPHYGNNISTAHKPRIWRFMAIQRTDPQKRSTNVRVPESAKHKALPTGSATEQTSSQTRAGDVQYQLSSTITGQKIDPEQGRDVTVVTWFGDNDPEVRILLDGPEAVAGAKRATDAIELVAFQEGIYYL